MICLWQPGLCSSLCGRRPEAFCSGLLLKYFSRMQKLLAHGSYERLMALEFPCPYFPSRLSAQTNPGGIFLTNQIYLGLFRSTLVRVMVLACASIDAWRRGHWALPHAVKILVGIGCFGLMLGEEGIEYSRQAFRCTGSLRFKVFWCLCGPTVVGVSEGTNGISLKIASG